MSSQSPLHMNWNRYMRDTTTQASTKPRRTEDELFSLSHIATPWLIDNLQNWINIFHRAELGSSSVHRVNTRFFVNQTGCREFELVNQRKFTQPVPLSLVTTFCSTFLCSRLSVRSMSIFFNIFFHQRFFSLSNSQQSEEASPQHMRKGATKRKIEWRLIDWFRHIAKKKKREKSLVQFREERFQLYRDVVNGRLIVSSPRSWETKKVYMWTLQPQKNGWLEEINPALRRQILPKPSSISHFSSHSASTPHICQKRR